MLRGVPARGCRSIRLEASNRRYRPQVKSPGPHPGERGSIPRSATKCGRGEMADPAGLNPAATACRFESDRPHQKEEVLALTTPAAIRGAVVEASEKNVAPAVRSAAQSVAQAEAR